MKSVLKIGLVVLFIISATTAWSQTKKVTGQVLSKEDNSPLSGVSIVKKGNPSGTQTNNQGQFTVQVAVGDVLVFSNVGFTSQQVTIGNTNVLNVMLSASTSVLPHLSSCETLFVSALPVSSPLLVFPSLAVKYIIDF